MNWAITFLCIYIWGVTSGILERNGLDGLEILRDWGVTVQDQVQCFLFEERGELQDMTLRIFWFFGLKDSWFVVASVENLQFSTPGISQWKLLSL